VHALGFPPYDGGRLWWLRLGASFICDRSLRGLLDARPVSIEDIVDVEHVERGVVDE